MTSFTPAQQTLYDVLQRADRGHVVIARQILRITVETGTEPDGLPEDFGVPVGDPEWRALTKAAEEAWGAPIRTAGDKAAASRFTLTVVDAVLAGRKG
jgi:hypothetical protein